MPDYSAVRDPSEAERMGRVNCGKVFVDRSRHGWGVFARRALAQGDVVETGLMIRLRNVDGHDNPHLHTWSDDRTVWGMPTGCIPLYNHDGERPNVRKIGDLDADTIIVVALRDIAAGEELRNTYLSADWRRCFADLRCDAGGALDAEEPEDGSGGRGPGVAP
jgi:SET domain-containing protein